MPRLLERLLLKGVVITVDALLTQRDIVRQIRQAGGHYLMYVKANQPRLLWALEARFAQLHKIPAQHHYKCVHKGHGRLETREIWTISDSQAFPHWPGVAQLFCLKRTRLLCKTNKFHESWVYGITSLPDHRASPAELIAITRDHWAAIENGLHWVRDVLMGEDLSSTRKPGAPHVRAALRNIVINLARMAGFPSISEAIDAFSADPTIALALLQL